MLSNVPRELGRWLADVQLEAALSDGKRIAFFDNHVVAYPPFAQVAAHEVRIVPHCAHADFAAATAEEVLAAAGCQRAVLAARRTGLAIPPTTRRASR